MTKRLSLKSSNSEAVPPNLLDDGNETGCIEGDVGDLITGTEAGAPVLQSAREPAVSITSKELFESKTFRSCLLQSYGTHLVPCFTDIGLR